MFSVNMKIPKNLQDLIILHKVNELVKIYLCFFEKEIEVT